MGRGGARRTGAAGSSGITGHDLDRLGPLQEPRRRAPFIAASRAQAPSGAGGRDRTPWPARARGCAVARQQAHDVAGAQPERQAVGEVDRAVLAQRIGRPAAVSGSMSCAAGSRLSTSGADRIISSTPKPGSSSPSFSSKSFIRFGIVAIGPAGADRRADRPSPSTR
jgi:hypothetical protein